MIFFYFDHCTFHYLFVFKTENYLERKLLVALAIYLDFLY